MVDRVADWGASGPLRQLPDRVTYNTAHPRIRTNIRGDCCTGCFIIHLAFDAPPMVNDKLIDGWTEISLTNFSSKARISGYRFFRFDSLFQLSSTLLV